jgi:hypothetical protein
LKIDLARSLRRTKPQKWGGTLKPRGADELHFVDDAQPLGPPLLLDTCGCLDALEARLPSAAKALITTRPVRHVPVVLGELTRLFGRLSRVAGNDQVLARLTKAIDLIEPRHVGRPSVGASLQAGIVCGLIFRLGGFQAGQQVTALNAATICLHALEHGLTIPKQDRNDFDRMNRILLYGRVAFHVAA